MRLVTVWIRLALLGLGVVLGMGFADAEESCARTDHLCRINAGYDLIYERTQRERDSRPRVHGKPWPRFIVDKGDRG